jgi:hypothetical protein
LTSHPAPLTPQDARDRLAESRTRRLGSRRDRVVHAAGTAVLGLGIGFLMATQNVVSGAGRFALTCAFLVVCVGVAIGVERAARTVPRRAKLWSRLGIGASVLVALAAVLPWLNLEARTEPNTWPMVVAGALVTAVPSLLAATVIVRSRR